MTLLSTKPYLIRAIHEWCLDQGFTPYIQVVVDHRTRVPNGHVRDGQIVLNVGTTATNQLVLGNEEIQFQARFNGAVFSILGPVDCVAAIYAKENGQGMAFDAVPADAAEAASDGDATSEVAPPDEKPDPPKPAGGRAHLTRIK